MSAMDDPMGDTTDDHKSSRRERMDITDKLLVQILNAAARYQELRTLEETTLKQAYMALAHAKYTMGPGRIGSLSYDLRMEPLVQISSLETGFVLEKCLKAVQSKTIQKETTLKKRHIAQSSGESENQSFDSKNDTISSSDSPRPRNKDPLLWFGGLTPQSLKDAQSYFRKTLSIRIELASLTCEIDNLMSSFQDVMSDYPK